MAKFEEWQLAVAEQQLDRVLGFFTRTESKTSALLAVDTALLGVLAVNSRYEDLAHWHLALPIVLTAIAIACSLFFLFRAMCPNLKGGMRSLVYFREIANLTEADYLKAIKECDKEIYTQQLQAQVWRNSEILKQKFDALFWAFVATALALPPWSLALLFSAIKYEKLVVN